MADNSDKPKRPYEDKGRELCNYVRNRIERYLAAGGKEPLKDEVFMGSLASYFEIQLLTAHTAGEAIEAGRMVQGSGGLGRRVD